MPNTDCSIDDDIARVILASRFDDDDGVALARLIAREVGHENARATACAFERAGTRLARICDTAAQAFRAALEYP